MIEDEYRERSGRIEVHTPDILEEIVADNAIHDSVYVRDGTRKKSSRSASAPVSKSCNRSSPFPPHTPVRSGSASPLHGCRIQTWLNEDSIKDIQERSSLESRSVRNQYKTVLDNEERLVQDADAFLEYVDVANENRRVELFKKWSERVYTPLQEKIKTEMKSTNFKSYEKRKQQLYDRYIDYQNRKGMVFLDVYSPEEYDPLELNNTRPGPLKAKIDNLDKNDPLLHQDFKKIVEDQDVIRCYTGYTTGAKDIKNYHLPPEPLVPLLEDKTLRAEHGCVCQYITLIAHHG
ncbi:protein FAM228B-like [Dendronephthya gigantea]|uniref:protein FAM228B-like n=1 Tax=Dendronephthya gigantea TaxID=151771 RepID=UPI0010693B81|nr:protein FAM228B-like [Dendronephthya gigantea]